MVPSRFRLRSGFCLACAAQLTLLSACSTSVVGDYQLDVDETKTAVNKSLSENPDMARLKDDTLKMLEAMKLNVALTADGKMSTVVVFSGPKMAPTEKKQLGTWKLDNKRVLIVNEGIETRCDVDAKRLRCENETLPPLLKRYVLQRK